MTLRRRPTVARHGTFPTTADMGLWARGPEASDLFEGLGLALFASMTDLRKVRPRETRTVERRADDPTALAVGFLSDLLQQFAGEGFLVRQLAVTVDPGLRRVRAELRGEPFDEARHSRGIEVKAITYHAAVVDPQGGRARIVVDI